MNVRQHAVQWSLLSGVVAMLWLGDGCDQPDTSRQNHTTAVINAEPSPAPQPPQVRAPQTAPPRLGIQAPKDPSHDPSWQPATEQVAVLELGEKGGGGNLHNFCLHTNGDILVCWGAREAALEDKTAAIKVLSPDGKLRSTWSLPSTPEAIGVDPDGTIYVGGGGRLFKLDSNGKILASADSPIRSMAVTLDKAHLESIVGKSLSDGECAMFQRSMENQKLAITGIAVTGEDVFAACPSPSDFTFWVYRFDRQLQNPKQILTDLHGCCGQLDIQAKDGKLWLAHNGRHLVESYDREGKKLFSFGKNDRSAADGFGGCCGPKNLRLASDGNIYAAESGPPACIKCFSTEGKFGGVTALPGFQTDCVRVSIDVTADCKRFYILNTQDDAIHVLEKKKS